METPISSSIPISFICAAGEVGFRPVTPDDEEFLVSLYGTTRAQEMALVSWTPAQNEAFVRMQFAAQGRHYREHHPDASHNLILLNGTPVGRLYVDRGESTILILDLLLWPAYRGQGIGTPIVKALMAEATTRSVPLRIHVETENPARALLRKLDFAEIEHLDFHVLLEWRSSPSKMTPLSGSE